MTTLLDTPKPKSKSFIVWEHVMISAVTFTGTFILLFFGPMFINSRSRGSKDSPGIVFIEYLFNNPTVYFGLTILAVIIANGYIVWKNQKIKYIVKIATDDHAIRFDLTNLYFTKHHFIIVPLSDFEFYFETNISDDNDKKQHIIFRNSKENTTIGEIVPNHFIWSERLRQIKAALQVLQPFKQKSRERKSKVPGISWLFGK